MRLRPEVRRFAEMMEAALRAHDSDRGVSWKTVPVSNLKNGLQAEIIELSEALERHFFYAAGGVEKTARRDQLLKECADVANFCMFLADRASLMTWSPRLGVLTDEEKDWAAIQWAEHNLQHLDPQTRDIVLAYMRTMRRKAK